jgi:hypothetical protein
MHISEHILDTDKKRIDPHKIDLVGRLGKSYYARASGNAVFEIVQPEKPLVIGYDGLPEKIRTSEYLTGNTIAQIAACTTLPSKEEVISVKKDIRVQKILYSDNILRGLHMLAQEELQKGNIELGVKLALYGEYLKD